MAKKLIDPVEIGRKGGKARAAALTKEELSAQGRKAVMARWEKARKGTAAKRRSK